MKEQVMTVTHAVGLHSRPAAKFVQIAKRFEASISITNITRNPERTVNAKSLVGLVKLACAEGHSIRLSAEGADEQGAIQSLIAFIEAGD